MKHTPLKNFPLYIVANPVGLVATSTCKPDKSSAIRQAANELDRDWESLRREGYRCVKFYIIEGAKP